MRVLERLNAKSFYAFHPAFDRKEMEAKGKPVITVSGDDGLISAIRFRNGRAYFAFLRLLVNAAPRMAGIMSRARYKAEEASPVSGDSF